MKKFRCGDVVPGCTRTFTGTQEEILQQVTEHARQDHGIAEVTPELAGTVTRLIRPA